MSVDMQLLAEVAHLYYEKDLTQQQIAQRLYTSRSRVSRLILQAKAEGIVEIKIHYSGNRRKALEIELAKYFPDMLDFRVIDNAGQSSSDSLPSVGRLGAEYLDTLLTSGTISILGIAWGNSVYNVVQALKASSPQPNLHVAQLTGAVESSNPATDGPDLVRTAAEAYGCRYHYLLVPLYVDGIDTKNKLINRPSIQENLALAQQAQVICTGIGAHDNWTYLDDSVRSMLFERGAVGYICGSYYDAGGRFVAEELRQRIISVDSRIFNTVRYRIGVAVGAQKVNAILGALRGKLINVLITDFNTANSILEMVNKGERA